MPRRVVDLAQENQPPGRRWSAMGVPPPETLFNNWNRVVRPGNRPCRNVSASSALSDRASSYPPGFSGKPFATLGLGGVRAIGARGLSPFPNYQKLAGKAGSSWGCRVGGSRSDPGRPKAASRRGEAPRGGAFLFLWACRSCWRRVIHRQGYPKTHRSPSDSKILLRFKIQGASNPQKTWKNDLEK